MFNKFAYSTTNKRYLTFDYYLKEKYNSKVFKVALNANFSCPNRDGKVGVGGCIFCSKYGSGEYAGDISLSLREQFDSGLKMMLKKWPDGKPLAYFQAFTNTYGSLEYLHKCFDQFVEDERVLGIVIATRPDCLSDEILDYLEAIKSKKDLYIELGLQTSNDETAKLINRGHDFDTFLRAVNSLSLRKIDTIVHLINGLPGETIDDMYKTVKDIASLPILGIKFHCLNILKDTSLADVYKDMNLHILTKDEYLEIVANQISMLPSNIVIERINTDAKRSELITPTWNIKKVSVSNDLDKLMIQKDLYQGSNYKQISDYISYAHKLSTTVKNNEIAVDATLGNGYDSLFLLHNFKKVYAFDIQDLAIKRSTKKLSPYTNIEIIKDSYVNIDKYVNNIDIIMYNLGFLPGSDHTIKTDYKETIESLNRAYNILNKDGKIIIVCYTIHDNSEEFNNLKMYLENNKFYDYNISNFDSINVIEIYKK